MFNGMMDPEMIRLAQEQMSRMSPAELARIQQQMMSNPDLMKMASESMKNMRPEDFKIAAEQLKHTRPEEMAEIGQKMANASPEEMAAMRARADAQITYELNAAEMLKQKGNELHSLGRFEDALQKYLLAKKNLQGIPSSKGRTLLLACSLNLMSCYLKTRQYGECIREGSEVLAYDTKNVKALYRRGQAYKELGQLEDAISDLSKALEVSPDETISDVLRDAKERLSEEGGGRLPRGVVIEEITEDVDAAIPANNKRSCTENLMVQPQLNNSTKNQSAVNNGGIMTNSEALHALKDDSEAIRSFQNFISNTDPDTLAALNPGKSGEIPPEMIKTASNMIGKMSPEELQKMLGLASSFQGETPNFVGGSSESDFNYFKPGSVPPNVTPDMLKTASDMMSKMSPGDLQKMFEMASSFRGKDSAPMATAANGSYSGPKSSGGQKNPLENRSSAVGESSSARGVFSDSINTSQSSFPTSTSDLQEQMRNQMKDPAMQQMFTSMIKNMSPDMMANMSEQFGLKLSREDAAKAQAAMSSLSPEDLDRMMHWADRVQRGVECAKKTKKWLLGRPGLILAICMLILAMILHRLGYIGG
ncbi:outer envelope protein 61 [Juglans microcarpa x Juglans regia]|uniref:outer envelope protein 61 n=1 Tax=Juglans microcarpa x Juglans regia TaxID=2249226 RepID=UPI001B7E9500|nr:outer envelope protein 61 [Juglans microcarpa x Juglans regia]